MSEVSIIVPCYNERNTIQLLLKACIEQTFPIEQMEVIIADGMSDDGTREQIIEFQAKHPEIPIRLVDNPRRSIPSGLNRAIEAAAGEFIIRLDAHSVPYPDYVERCVSDLKAGLGDSVGGIWVIRPQDGGWQARAIAIAASHPLAVGDALYRFTAVAQEVDTLPFGAFRKNLIDMVGAFDESLQTNEDYEFNVRLRKSGGRIFLDPEIRSVYYARSNSTFPGSTVLAIWVLEGSHAPKAPKHDSLAASAPPLVCTFFVDVASAGCLVPRRGLDIRVRILNLRRGIIARRAHCCLEAS